MSAVYVTGNPHKAEFFAKMTQLDIPHVKIDVEEIQSLFLKEIVEHKARQAYSIVKKPVIIEDTKLTFNALGELPGSFIKWFLQELEAQGLCDLLTGYEDRSARAGAAIAYYDGLKMKIFERELGGIIVKKPAGSSGFGWNRIFVPDGAQTTLGQMSEDEFKKWYGLVKPFDELADFIQSIDNK